MDGVEKLRSRVDDETRFKRALNGYDVREVNDYVSEMKHSLQKQACAAKLDQQQLMMDLDAARTENAAKEETILAQASELSRAGEALAARDAALAERDAQIEKLRARTQEYERALRLLAKERGVQSPAAEIADAQSASRLMKLTELQTQVMTLLAEKLKDGNALLDAWRKEADALAR